MPVATPLAADDRLPSLTLALDPQQAKKRIVKRLLGLPSKGSRVEAIEVIRYKPGRRCVVEYLIRTPASENVRVIGKVRAGRSGTSAYRLMKALWESGFDDRSSDRVSIPEPLGVVRKFRMWVQRRVPGETATAIFCGSEGPALARRIAEAAHKLHTLPPATTRKHTMADELRILEQRLPGMKSARVDRLLEGCVRLGASLPKSESRGIHRDFYSDQILVDSNRLYLIDFDLYCVGDPALDIGNFLAHVTEQSIRQRGTPEALEGVERALCKRYLELAGKSLEPAVEVYKTLSLARLIHLSTVLPDRSSTTLPLLDLCESRLRST